MQSLGAQTGILASGSLLIHLAVDETFQQSGKQNSFRHIFKRSASMYESSSLVFQNYHWNTIRTRCLWWIKVFYDLFNHVGRCGNIMLFQIRSHPSWQWLSSNREWDENHFWVHDFDHPYKRTKIVHMEILWHQSITTVTGWVQSFLREKQKQLTHLSLRYAITKNLHCGTLTDDHEQKSINHISFLHTCTFGVSSISER